jgi:hypothetical protein
MMLEKALKAVLDSKTAYYVMARPVSEPNRQQLEQLGSQFAQGGKRASGKDPAVILLDSIGLASQSTVSTRQA